MAKQGGAGHGRQGSARPGRARHGRHGVARLGVAWHGKAGVAWQGMARRGAARPGKAGVAWLGLAGLGTAGEARLGAARPGEARQAWRGEARLGVARQGRPGAAGHGGARRGKARQAWRGRAWRGKAGRGNTRRDGHHYKRPAFSTMKTKPNETASLEELLGKIAQKHGGTLTPEQVLKAATPKSSPLHQHFQWDDTEAAKQYRLMQAGQLIRRVRITYAPCEGREFRVRAFVNVTPEACEDESPRGHYVSFETARLIPNYREQLLANARRDAETFKQKYATLEEMLPIIQAIDAGLAR